MRVLTTSHDVRQIAYVSGGARLAACATPYVNTRHMLEWWDLRTGKINGSVGLPGNPWAVAFALARRPELVAHPNGDQIHYFSQNSYDRAVIPGGRSATACALTSDGSRIAYSSRDDSSERSIIAVTPLDHLDQGLEFRTGTLVRNLLFDPTGNYLVSNGVGQYTVWDLNRRESRTAGTLDDLRPIIYSHDGAMLAVAGNAGATIFTADGSRTIRSIQRPGNAAVRALAFVPDNRALLLAAGWAIHVFEVGTGFLRQTYEWNVGAIYSLAVSPDGLTAAAGATGHIIVWDLDD
jgi:WD40 repeat protein